jgi:hypothetical protein
MSPNPDRALEARPIVHETHAFLRACPYIRLDNPKPKYTDRGEELAILYKTVSSGWEYDTDVLENIG